MRFLRAWAGAWLRRIAWSLAGVAALTVIANIALRSAGQGDAAAGLIVPAIIGLYGALFVLPAPRLRPRLR